MKLLLFVSLVLTGFMAPAAVPCVGAIHAMAVASQERSTPQGEWCQRPQEPMPKKAHACSCHAHDCSDPNPTHVSAHTDANCLNFCTVERCACVSMDCP